MKANELMIGDWVQNPLGATGWVKNIQLFPKEDDGFGGYYVIDISYSKDGDSYARLEEKDISPIPLTDEFLRDNGFEYFHKNYASLSYEHPFALRLDKWPDENGLGAVWTICEIIEIRYVHQLQHALRDCGIDKEIKIKLED